MTFRRRGLRWLGGLVVVSLCSCGDDEAATDGASGDGTSVDDGGSDGSSAADDATTGADTGGSSDGSSDGSSADSSGGGGVCEPDGELLWPLEVGRAWHYDLLCSCDCDSMDWFVEVTAMVEIGGRSAFEVHEGCGIGDFASYYSLVDGVVEKYDEFGEVWNPIWEEPIEDGRVWSAGFTQWTAVPEVSVGAGTFTDCWKAEDIASPKGGGGGPVYCPGVGVVQHNGFETDQSLASCSG